MITLDDLRIPIFSEIDDASLKKLRDIADVKEYEDGEVVYTRDDPAEYFFIVLSGEAVLEYKLSDEVQVIFSSISPGYCFGWTALSDTPRHASARNRGASRYVVIPAKALRTLLDEDHDLGYHVYRAFAKIALDQLFIRTDQFINMLSHHPDLKNAL